MFGYWTKVIKYDNKTYWVTIKNKSSSGGYDSTLFRGLKRLSSIKFCGNITLKRIAEDLIESYFRHKNDDLIGNKEFKKWDGIIKGA